MEIAVLWTKLFLNAKSSGLQPRSSSLTIKSNQLMNNSNCRSRVHSMRINNRSWDLLYISNSYPRRKAGNLDIEGHTTCTWRLQQVSQRRLWSPLKSGPKKPNKWTDLFFFCMSQIFHVRMNGFQHWKSPTHILSEGCSMARFIICTKLTTVERSAYLFTYQYMEIKSAWVDNVRKGFEVFEGRHGIAT